MKTDKRGNRYRTRKMINGVSYTLLTDKKPSKQEVEAWVSGIISKTNALPVHKMDFGKAAALYVETKENVLSQSSVREYYRKIERIPEWFIILNIDTITYFQVQQVINEYAINHAPKTVRDLNGFITSVLAYFDVRLDKVVNLPQRIKQDAYLPTDDDVKAIIEASKGTIYEGMVGLAVCGLRRSEICALTAADVKDNVVHINKALVQDKDKNWVIKSTKTTQSTRDVPIPPDLAEWIIKNGKAYDGFAGSINKWLTTTQTRLNIPHFSIHKLRHYFASKLIYMGFSKREVEVLGGWEKNSQVLESIYSQCMLANTENGRKEIMKKFTSGLF